MCIFASDKTLTNLLHKKIGKMNCCKSLIVNTISLCYLLCAGFSIQAQSSTFEKVSEILQTNCATAYCHVESHGLPLNGTIDELYDNLINVSATNSAAAAKGLKLISPGYPDNSFLFQKIHNGLYQHSAGTLNPAEGQVMPPSSPLDNVDIEIIRQWILFGAPKEGMTHNQDIIEDYYVNGGLEKLSPPEAPEEGFQIYFGPIFLAPQEEIEVHKKYAVDNKEAIESNRIEIIMQDFSHHFAFYRYNEDVNDEDFPPGIQIVSGFAGAIEYFINTEFIATSPLPYKDYQLPSGTAFKWKPNTTFDINYHIKNYSTTDILPAELYLNIHTQTPGSEQKEMVATSLLYGDLNPFKLKIYNNAKDTTFTESRYDEESNEIWNIWLIQAHTHQLGVDYDIFLRNEDGTKGEQVYEGFYNESYSFNQGFYDWSHPPVRIFDELLKVDMRKGLIHEATFYNDGDTTVTFGLTTEHEMFATYLLYTKEEITTDIIDENTGEKDLSNQLSVSPNPFNKNTKIRFALENNTGPATVDLALYNINGQKVCSVFKGRLSSGIHQYNMFDNESQSSALPKGIYFLKLITNNKESVVKKVVKVF